MERKITECCPHCGTENNLLYDVEENGYVINCSNCHKEIMLCDECSHNEDNPKMKCDWKNDKCFRGVCHNLKEE